MKNIKLHYLIAAMLLSLSTHTLADTAGDTQTVSITIPSVKLIDVKSASGTSTSANEVSALSFTLTAPTVAGENFSSTNTNGYVDLSSNVASGGSTTRKVTVSADTLGAGWKLDIDASASSVGTGNSISFTSADVTSKDLITAIGNEAGKDNTLTYTFGPESASIVPSYTGDGTGAGGQNEDITLTFTLSDDT